MAWTCPECGRLFARSRQMHECSPAMTLDEYFSTGPEFEQPIFDVVIEHLESLGPMHIEPVSVGIFIKSSGSFVQLRPKTRWVALSFSLTRTVSDGRISRKPIDTGSRVFHVVNLRSPDDFDDQVRNWLTESFADFG